MKLLIGRRKNFVGGSSKLTLPCCHHCWGGFSDYSSCEKQLSWYDGDGWFSLCDPRPLYCHKGMKKAFVISDRIYQQSFKLCWHLLSCLRFNGHQEWRHSLFPIWQPLQPGQSSSSIVHSFKIVILYFSFYDGNLCCCKCAIRIHNCLATTSSSGWGNSLSQQSRLSSPI